MTAFDSGLINERVTKHNGAFFIKIAKAQSSLLHPYYKNIKKECIEMKCKHKKQ